MSEDIKSSPRTRPRRRTSIFIRSVALIMGKRWFRAMHKPYFWFVAAMLAVGGILEYGGVLDHLTQALPFGLTLRYMEHALFLLPVVYAGFIFGLGGGIATLLAAAALMLPHAVLLTPNSTDALFESISIIIVASLILVMFEGQEKEKQRRREIVGRLEVARQELSSHIDLIKKNERELSAINEVSRVVTQSLELPQTLDLILAKVSEVTGMEVGLIFLLDKDAGELELAAYRGITNESALEIAILKVGDGFNGKVAEWGQPMLVKDTLTDPGYRGIRLKQEGLRSQLIVPLKSKGLTIGTLCVATRSIRGFPAEEMELLTAICSQVGITIENARLYEKVRASEANYRDLFENASLAMFVNDLKGSLVAANKACVDLTGYAREELIGMNVSRLRPQGNGRAAQEAEEKMLRGETTPNPLEIRLLKKDGAECITSMTTRLIVKDGQPTGFEHIARDITEWKRMRESLDFYLRQIISAQEEERRRIARELHDETAQSMLIVSQRLDSFATDSRESLSDESRAYLAEIRSIALKALRDMRRMTQDLRPGILDDLGLVAALEWLADDLDRQYGIKSSMKVTGDRQPLTPEMQLCLFRIAQEAFNNVRRHSEATLVSVLLHFDHNRIVLTVEDNGKGFRLPPRLSDLADSSKLGMLGMQERARLFGGAIRVQSTIGKGTSVTADLPLPRS